LSSSCASSARTRWGSCAPDGSIRLNWRLVHFPIEIVDYLAISTLSPATSPPVHQAATGPAATD
jgi:hypothetical protein